MCIFDLLRHFGIFFLTTIGMYIMYKKLNVIVSINTFILSFILLCSVLVYHRYNNAHC